MKIIINKFNNTYGCHAETIKYFDPNWKIEDYMNAPTYNPNPKVYYIFDGKPEKEIIIK